MRFSKFGYLIYPVLGALCLAWAVSGFLHMKISPPEVSFSDSHAIAEKRRVKLPDSSLILEKNIFKAEVDADPIVSMQTDITAPNSTASAFDGRLLGVLTGDGKSLAVMSYNGKKYILHEGQQEDGLTLKEVGYFHAVVSERGQSYRIFLKTDDKKTGNTPGTVHKIESKNTGSERFTVSRKEVVEKLSDVNSVIKSVLIVPYEKDGEFLGYRVRRMTNTSVLKKVGVERNDVIMRLNGKSLETPAVFFDTLKNAQNLSSISLDVLRRGNKKTIYVEIEG